VRTGVCVGGGLCIQNGIFFHSAFFARRVAHSLLHARPRSRAPAAWKPPRAPRQPLRCIAIACPACMTRDLAASCADYVTSVVNSADVVPTISSASADDLRTEVMRR
jgi:hypothetical protein